jgi:pimeloyl-ACP methyl ester carboxylesterase
MNSAGDHGRRTDPEVRQARRGRGWQGGAVTSAQPVTSRTVDLGGPVHYLDAGGPPDGPLVVAVHGLGGAAWNWLSLTPLLTPYCRVLAIDLAGHGLTPARGRPTTVQANRQLLDRFVREVAGEPVVLIGNSMGGMITLLESAASPDVVRGAVLVDPALPRPLLSKVDPRVAVSFAIAALPGLGEAALNRRAKRQTPERQMRETLMLCTVDVSRVDPAVVDAGLEVLHSRGGDDFTPADFLGAARSLLRLLSRPRRVRRILQQVSAPVLLLHGDHDRLVSIDVARVVAAQFPAWRFEIAKDIGHVPMLEDPKWTADTILDWMRTDAGLLP